MGNNFPARLVISINQPDFVTLFADKRPKFIYLQCWIMRALWAGLMGTALQRRLNLAAAVAGNAANIADAASNGRSSAKLACLHRNDSPDSQGYGRQQTACHSPCTGIFACYCRICRFALYSAHGNGDSKWYFELPHLKYTVSPLLFVCPSFFSIHFRTPPKIQSIIAIHRKFQTRRVAEDSTRLYGEATQHSMRLSVDGYKFQEAN